MFYSRFTTSLMSTVTPFFAVLISKLQSRVFLCWIVGCLCQIMSRKLPASHTSLIVSEEEALFTVLSRSSILDALATSDTEFLFLTCQGTASSLSLSVLSLRWQRMCEYVPFLLFDHWPALFSAARSCSCESEYQKPRENDG